MRNNDVTVTVMIPDLLHPAGKDFWLDDSMFPLDDEGMHVPRFSVQEASKAFFGAGADWLRWRMRPDRPSKRKCPVCKGQGAIVTGSAPSAKSKICKNCKGKKVIIEPPKHPDGFFVLNGKPLEFKRLKVAKDSAKVDDPNAITARYYTLADIERMARALAQQGIINGVQLSHIVLMVRCCARLYGISGLQPVIAIEPPKKPRAKKAPPKKTAAKKAPAKKTAAKKAAS